MPARQPSVDERPPLRLILFAMLIIVSALAIYFARFLLLAALLGIVFANLIGSLSLWASSRTQLRYRLVATLSLLLSFTLLVGLFFFAFIAAANQLDQLSASLNQAINSVNHWTDEHPWSKKLLEEQSSEGELSRLWSWFTSMMANFVSMIGPVMIFFAVLIYVSFDPQTYRRGILWLVPQTHVHVAREIMDNLSVALVWWVLGRGTSMLIVGVLSWLCLWALDIPAPLALGLIAGLFSFVPNIGPIVSVVPALASALTVGPWSVLWVALAYIGIQTVESNLITPLIEQRAVSVPPALLILFQLAMGLYAGLWGLITATPLLVVLMVIVQILYIRAGLGKDGPLLTESAPEPAPPSTPAE